MCSKVLVTGGAGFIGSHIVDRLLAGGMKVVVLDNLQEGRFENIQQHSGDNNFLFVRGDVRDSRIVRNTVRDVDAVIHQAALVSVPQSVADPILTNDVNVGGTLNLVKASMDFHVKRFVYASSSAIYGNADTVPINEGFPPRPASPYGVSKLAAENYVTMFHEVFGIETVCLRYFNVYGPRQACSQYSGVISQFLNRIAENAPLVIFGDGKQTRDFVHVQDVAEANILALEAKQISEGRFNIATGVATTLDELATMLLRITSRTHSEIVHSNPRKGDIRHSVADISEARRKLHYTPKISLKDGLRQFASKDRAT
jgi:UDP-glucose 4-epimerase